MSGSIHDDPSTGTTEADDIQDHPGPEMEYDQTRRRRSLGRPTGSHYRGGDKPQPKRWRCLVTGCNPTLNESTAQAHKDETGHRVAKWPVRSKEGKRRARERNRNGYYDQYNVGALAHPRRLGGGG